jgi:uncharacterized OB-fold protein
MSRHPVATGSLRLQHCAECGKVQYPRREVCGNCLSPKLEWRLTNGAAKVLSHTRLHISLDPKFEGRLPLDVALVQLDAGPVCYAFAAAPLATGDRVSVDERTDGDGEALLWAALA